MKNVDIRSAITAAGLKFWEVAEAYGCADTTFSKRLRHELPDAEKNKILEAIEVLKKGRRGKCRA